MSRCVPGRIGQRGGHGRPPVPGCARLAVPRQQECRTVPGVTGRGATWPAATPPGGGGVVSRWLSVVVRGPGAPAGGPSHRPGRRCSGCAMPSPGAAARPMPRSAPRCAPMAAKVGPCMVCFAAASCRCGNRLLRRSFSALPCSGCRAARARTGLDPNECCPASVQLSRHR